MEQGKKLILLVEDEPVVGKIQKKHLLERGYEVQHVSSGEDAVGFVEHHPHVVDLLLMDIDLGEGIDGTQASREILEKEEIPILFFSSHVEKEVVRKTRGIPHFGYVVKASGPEVLDASIQVALQLHQANQEVEQKTLALEKANQELRESERRFRAVYENMALGVAQVSLSFRILAANPAYCRLLGYSEKELVGKHLEEITAPEVLEKNLQLQEQLGRGEIDHFRLEKTFLRKNRDTVHGILDANLVRTETGKPSYFLGTVVDITLRKTMERSLQQNEERYRKAQQIGQIGNWELDLGSGKIWGSDGAKRLFGFPLDEDSFSLEAIERCIPERERVHQALLDLLEKQIPYDITYEIQPADGSEKRFLHSNAEVLRNEHAMPQKVLGVIHDVSQQVATERELTGLVEIKETLLRELNHRVKNNLNAISSLLELEIPRLPDPLSQEIFRKTRHRIKSMSSLYDSLLRTGNINRVALDEYVQTLSRSLFSSLGAERRNVMLALDVEPVCIDASKAVPIGLILHELLTNAMKYAFPSGRSGTVRVVLAPRAGRAQLGVCDDGVGFPSSPPLPAPSVESKGLGLMLVEVLARQIGAEFRVEQRQGASIWLVFDSSCISD
ncbi:MAG TPA: PAS domain S-box protein [Thermotogota bacterium]|nr:PAS domain S-box protein [Thermotogota bacterium]HRW91502.1 PAS domain S-box protein [Thermotogota bacterium]